MANFFKGNDPLVITNTNVNKTKKVKSSKGSRIEFISRKIVIYLSSLLIILSLFLPFLKVTVKKATTTYPIFEMNNITGYFFISVAVIGIIGALVNSKVLLFLTFVDCAYSFFRLYQLGTSKQFGFANNTLLSGFYVFCIGLALLAFTSLWYSISKSDQLY